MPRGPSLPKTVRGKRVTHGEFTIAIMEAIVVGGDDGASFTEIAERLGDEWMQIDTRPLLSSTLNNMKGRGALRREDGIWYPTIKGVRAPSINAGLLLAIDEVFLQHGGYCRWADVMDAFGGLSSTSMSLPLVPPIPDAEQQAEDPEAMTRFKQAIRRRAEMAEAKRTLGPRYSGMVAHLSKTLREHPRYRQDLGERGLYNLPEEMLAKLPMRGRWLAKRIRKQCDGAFDKTGRVLLWRREAEEAFRRVGVAFQHVLDRNAVSTVTLFRTGLLDGPLRALDGARNRIATGLVEEEARLLLAEEIAQDADLAADKIAQEQRRAELIAAEDKHRLLHLFLSFFDGYWETHMRMPLGFYQTFAEAYGVDAVALSHGIGIPALNATGSGKLRDDPTERYAERLKAKREAALGVAPLTSPRRRLRQRRPLTPHQQPRNDKW